MPAAPSRSSWRPPGSSSRGPPRSRSCAAPSRPVYHRKEERIRAHVTLCWLALLLARIAENACGATWPELRRQLDRITVGTFNGPAGTFRQRTEISPGQAGILEQLGIDPPPRIYQLTPAVSR